MVESWSSDGEVIVQVIPPAETIVQVTGGGGGGGGTLPDGVVLGGVGPPQTAASGIPPLDGVHDPWRPIDEDGDWVGQFYAVSWVAGGQLPTHPLDPDASYYWYWPGPGTLGNVTPTWEDYLVDHGDVSVAVAVLANYEFAVDGSGILGLGFYNASDPPDSSIDLADYVGTGVTIIGTYEFPDGTPVSALPAPDGYYYIDSTDPSAPVLYGPKTGGDWGNGTAVQTVEYTTDIEFDDNDIGPVIFSPNYTRYRVTVADDGTLGTTAI